MIDKLRQLEKKGLITLRKHNDLPLYIASYTREVKFDRLWDKDPLLKQCRGLIVDEDGIIVARPFEAFFNYQEHQELDSLQDIPTDQRCEVTLKEDGSLGIIYWYDDKWRVATRGSFHSEQADKARELLDNYKLEELEKDYTYLVEIIYPSNRIVVSYNEEKLVLITKIRTEDGYEPLNVTPVAGFEVVRVYQFDNIESALDEFKDKSGQEMEGVVFHYESGLRIKVKLKDYVRLHRLVTGITARSIWQLLKDGEDVMELYKEAPDEIYWWVEDTAEMINKRFKIKKYLAKGWFEVIENELGVDYTRKDFALKVKNQFFIKTHNLQGSMFLLLDDKPIDDYIWKIIKPPHETY